LSFTAERNLLLSENRALKDEVWRQRRDARSELARQRAKVAAMEAERAELENLAAEAKRLIQLKEQLYTPDGTPRLPGDNSASAWPFGQLSSEEAKLQAEAFLAEQHAAVVQRAQALPHDAAPRIFRNIPCVPERDPDLESRMQKVKRARRPARQYHRQGTHLGCS